MIRRYHSADLEKAALVLKQAFAEKPWNENWDLELAKTRIEELMAGPMSIGYVCEEENNILGIMLGRKTTYICGIEYFVDEFCISPSAQRKGTGTSMIDYARQELAELGFADIALNTEKGYPSEMFYKKTGFVQKENLIFMYLNF